MPLTRLGRLRDLFRIRWTRPVTEHEAGQVLARRAAEKRQREALVAGPYLEMFARTERPGWTSWGNQTDKFKEALEAWARAA